MRSLGGRCIHLKSTWLAGRLAAPRCLFARVWTGSRWEETFDLQRMLFQFPFSHDLPTPIGLCLYSVGQLLYLFFSEKKTCKYTVQAHISRYKFSIFWDIEYKWENALKSKFEVDFHGQRLGIGLGLILVIGCNISENRKGFHLSSVFSLGLSFDAEYKSSPFCELKYCGKETWNAPKLMITT